MGFENPVVGGTALRIPAIQSPDFLSGSTGWIIRIDGSAEFNDLTIRGTFHGNAFTLDEDGFFLYDGTPAAGNLIASIAGDEGTDEFGNEYFTGINVYSGDEYAGLNTGNLVLGNPSAHSIQTPGLIGISVSDSVFAKSATEADIPDAATWQLVPGDATTTPLNDDFFPHLDVGASSDGTAVWVHGPVVYATANGGTSSSETWHAPTMGTGWATGPGISGSYPDLMWRRDAEDNVHIFGTFHSTGSSASGIVATGLPEVDIVSLGGVGVLGNAVRMTRRSTIDTDLVIPMYLNDTGQLRAIATPTVQANDTWMVNATVPLGNIS